MALKNFTKDQAQKVLNLLARDFYNVDIGGNGLRVRQITNDPEAWKHCDIQQRDNLVRVVKKLDRILGK